VWKNFEKKSMTLLQIETAFRKGIVTRRILAVKKTLKEIVKIAREGASARAIYL
jgi:hypothetical protein